MIVILILSIAKSPSTNLRVDQAVLRIQRQPQIMRLDGLLQSKVAMT